MPSREERGAYGHGRKVSDKVLDNYNPLGYRITPFPEEKVCAFCESKCDVIFPMTPKVCEACAVRIANRQDIMKKFQRKMDLGGYKCDACGRNTFFPIIVNTRACNKCTIKLGDQVKRNNISKAYGARRVV